MRKSSASRKVQIWFFRGSQLSLARLSEKRARAGNVRLVCANRLLREIGQRRGWWGVNLPPKSDTNDTWATVVRWRAAAQSGRDQATRHTTRRGTPALQLKPVRDGNPNYALPHGRDARPHASPSCSGLARSPSPRCRALAARPSAERLALPIRRTVALRDAEAVAGPCGLLAGLHLSRTMVGRRAS